MRWWIDGAVGQFRTSASIVWLMPTGRIGMAISKKIEHSTMRGGRLGNNYGIWRQE